MNVSSTLTSKASFVFAWEAKADVIVIGTYLCLSQGETEEQGDCVSFPSSCTVFLVALDQRNFCSLSHLKAQMRTIFQDQWRRPEHPILINYKSSPSPINERY